MKLFLKVSGEIKPFEEVVDSMKVGSKVRYSFRNKRSGSRDDSEIVKFLSGSDCLVVIKLEGGEKRKFEGIRFGKVTESNEIYLSGSIVCRLNGEILRVKQNVI